MICCAEKEVDKSRDSCFEVWVLKFKCISNNLLKIALGVMCYINLRPLM